MLSLLENMLRIDRERETRRAECMKVIMPWWCFDTKQSKTFTWTSFQQWKKEENCENPPWIFRGRTALLKRFLGGKISHHRQRRQPRISWSSMMSLRVKPRRYSTPSLIIDKLFVICSITKFLLLLASSLPPLIKAESPRVSFAVESSKSFCVFSHFHHRIDEVRSLKFFVWLKDLTSLLDATMFSLIFGAAARKVLTILTFELLAWFCFH